MLVVGVDIGGSSIVAAVIDSERVDVLSRDTILTQPKRGPQDGFDRLGKLIEKVISDAHVSLSQIYGIGVGCTGPIDSITGTIHNPYTLPTWEGSSPVKYLQNRFKLPVVLLNDAAVAALGEYWAGAGRGSQHMIYITVGTGIGSGLILDGRLYRGGGLLAGEVGHQALDINGPACYCGARGCLEMLAAAPAIARFAAQRATPDGILFKLAGSDPARITAKLVYAAARQGDAVALEVMQQTGFYLGVGIANLLNILTPEIVILGGGVMQGWDLITPTLFETVQQRGSMVALSPARIVPASLKLNAGVMGAARGLINSLAGKL